MDRILELINFVMPAAAVSVEKASDAIEGDPWPGVESDDAKMQRCLDMHVRWRNGVKPPSGATVRAAIASWQASRPTPESIADALARDELENSRLVKAVALWAAQRFGVSAATARNEITAIYKTL